jgi:hypothetical protein
MSSTLGNLVCDAAFTGSVVMGFMLSPENQLLKEVLPDDKIRERRMCTLAD